MFDFPFADNDYSQPAARNYELDRSQVTLNDIIGVGQFGDVHIGVCQLGPVSKPNPTKDTSSQNSDNESTVNETIDSDKNIINVAVKTCKADADLITSEKFLEEACKPLLKLRVSFLLHSMRSTRLDYIFSNPFQI